METRTHTQPAECREYFGDDGGQLGAIITYRHFGRARHIVELNDWCRDGSDYFPVCIGGYDDLGEAETLIETAARNAQAPETVKDPLLDLLAEHGMRPAEMTGGRMWEWEHDGLTYQAVSRNGASSVEVFSLRPKAGWPPPITTTVDRILVVVRDTNGRGAKSVAEEIYKELTQ